MWHSPRNTSRSRTCFLGRIYRAARVVTYGVYVRFAKGDISIRPPWASFDDYLLLDSIVSNFLCYVLYVNYIYTVNLRWYAVFVVLLPDVNEKYRRLNTLRKRRFYQTQSILIAEWLRCLSLAHIQTSVYWQQDVHKPRCSDCFQYTRKSQWHHVCTPDWTDRDRKCLHLFVYWYFFTMYF